MQALLLALLPQTAAPAEFVDLDGDGLLDRVAVVEGALQLTWNRGARHFEAATAAPAARPALDVLVEDLDRDGRPDLFLLVPGGIEAWVADGLGGFANTTRELGLEAGPGGIALERRDLDGDGGLELIVESGAGSPAGSVVFWRTPQGGFERESVSWSRDVARSTPVVHPPSTVEADGVSKLEAPRETGSRPRGVRASLRTRTSIEPERGSGQRAPRVAAPGATTGAGILPSNIEPVPYLANGGLGVPGGSLILTEGDAAPRGFAATGWCVRTDEPELYLTRTGPPEARRGCSSALWNGRIYLLGGTDTGGTVTASCDVYEPASDTWSPLAPMPTPQHRVPHALVGSTVYVINGWKSGGAVTPSVQAYDLALDQWSTRTKSPSPHAGGTAQAVDGRIYVFGGVDGVGFNANVDVYDPATDTWGTKPTPMPRPRQQLTSTVFQGAVYLFGGWTGVEVATFERYDPATDTWTELPNLRNGRTQAAVTLLEDRFLLFGGRFSTGWTESVEEYDPVTGRWSDRLPMRGGRLAPVAHTIGRRVYLPSSPMFGMGSDEVTVYLRGARPLYVHRRR